jgi:hypothetical protein
MPDRRNIPVFKRLFHGDLFEPDLKIEVAVKVESLNGAYCCRKGHNTRRSCC